MVNPYDTCVANNMVDGAQMTVCWHVDDIQIPQRNEEMVTAFAVEMSNIHGTKTAILRGRLHDYIGTELDLGTCPGTLIISMIK